jgi:hypothetical protein
LVIGTAHDRDELRSCAWVVPTFFAVRPTVRHCSIISAASASSRTRPKGKRCRSSALPHAT